MPASRSSALLLGLALLAWTSPAAAGWPHDPSVNVPVCTATGNQGSLRTMPDGAGGAFVLWTDYRTDAVNGDLYAQHLNAAGQSLWTANGVAVCTAANQQYGPQLCSDGAGGIIVTWEDLRSVSYFQVYAQRLNASGVAQWTANGVAVAPNTTGEYLPAIASDRSGGAVISWFDLRTNATTSYDIYVQRLNSLGAAQWTAGGVLLCNAAGMQRDQQVAIDASGMALVTWGDNRGATTDIYAQRVSMAGVPQWTANGFPICSAAGAQYSPQVVNDGTGCCVIAWIDMRNGNYDLYAQRIDVSTNQAWGANGIPVVNDPASPSSFQMVSDGQGGTVYAWIDDRNYAGTAIDVYAQNLNASGTMSWGASGLQVNALPGSQNINSLYSDGLGNTYLAWDDQRTVPAHIYAQKLNSYGSVQWAYNGTQVTSGTGGQSWASIYGDGQGGAVCVFSDVRGSGGTSDVYAQGIDTWGYLGAEPSLASVRDVPNDQGGQVKVSWNASPLDTDPAFYNVIHDYLVFRSVPPAIAQARIRSGAGVQTASEFRRGSAGALLVTRDAASTVYWENVGTEIAHHLSGYSHVTPTTSDSIAGSNPPTKFMVMAESYSGTPFWSTAIDSGYSVDNLPPAVPAPFTGQYAAGAAHLHWSPNPEADIAGYRLYRGSDAGFTPGPGNMVAAPADTGYTDASGAPAVYKLAAVDAHGNLSPYATLVPSGVLDVSAPQGVALFLAAPVPNPAHRASGGTLRFGLPAAGDVKVTVYDAMGRVVRTLAAGSFAAGEHRLPLDTRDDAGRALAPGLYLVRMETAAGTFTRRLAILD